MIPDHSQRPLADLIRLDGRRAVVTGGAKGIGGAISARLAEAGADVMIADIDLDGARITAADIAARTGRRVMATALDVTDSSSIAAAAERCVTELGGLEIWVNNAGVFPTTGPVADASDEDFDRLLHLNVTGTLTGAREAARRMKIGGRGGVIVNLASIAGFRAIAGMTGYVTSKHAVVGLTKNLAIELAPFDIRVVGVAPGAIHTPGVDAQMAPLKAAGVDVAAQMSRTLLGRGGQPDDIARVALFLVSDLAAWVNGDIVVVDAGSTAQ
jgi:NAD(P)-dependent dehydrogenase (short-subunit alcohol dehydrogenase family)